MDVSDFFSLLYKKSAFIFCLWLSFFRNEKKTPHKWRHASGKFSYFFLFHSITLYFLVFPTAFRLHIKCTPKRKVAVAVRSRAAVPAGRVTTATAATASSASTRVSTTAISVSTVLCSPFPNI